MRYEHVVAAVFGEVWAILPEKLREIAAVIAFRAAGQAFVELMLAPLRANRQSAVLLDTLLCWITHGFNARTAAETLNVHYKTVVYRLDRITELTGWHLADPALRFQLQLIDRILSLNDKITR